MSCYLPISYVFLVISRVLFLEKLWNIIVHSSLQFWQRNRPGFAALYGILVEYWLGIVFPSVISSFTCVYVCHISLYFFLIKKNKDKGRIHWNCSALPRVFLVIYVFSCLKRIPEGFLPSSTPHLSKALHITQFVVPNHFPTLPHRDLCKTEPHSPDPNFPFPFEPTKHH